MKSYWQAWLSLLLYVVLIALVAVNLTTVLEWPLGLAFIPPVVVMASLFITGFMRDTRGALFVSLLVYGSISLLAVAVVLAVPAWQVIADGASDSWAGRMLPLLIAALALHACNLWVSTMNSAQYKDSIERLARILYGPGILASLMTALILCAGLILGMELLARDNDAQAITRRLLERGIIPPLTVLLFFWGVLLLLGKWWNGWYLQRVLVRWYNTSGSQFTPTLSTTSLSASFDTLVLGSEQREEGLQLLWRRHEESWLIPRYISWAVPILGFIGTVLGISLAAEGIRRIIASESGLASLSSDLDGAIAPLGIAFDTTLIALSLSIALTLLLALVQRSEQRLLATIERNVREVARASS